MNHLVKKFSRCDGVSILEILIATIIMGIVTTAIFQLYITQHRNYMVQDDITNIQQNARAAIDELSRHVRMAGYRLPEGLEAIEAYDTNPDTIVLTYKAGTCDTYLSAPMPQPSSELKCGNDISCFWDGQWVFIFDPDSGGGEWFEITQVQTASGHIQHNTMTLSRAYDANAILLAVTQVKFFIDNTTNPDRPHLMLQLWQTPPQVFAEDIEDLQFQYRMKNGVISDVPALVDNVREVLISVVGRSAEPDNVDAKHPYRRRTFSTSVNLRNIQS